MFVQQSRFNIECVSITCSNYFTFYCYVRRSR